MEMVFRDIEAKSVLVPNKGPSKWFGVKFNYNIYRACPHNCIYCDSRSECYQIEDFETIQVKRNAPDLLDQTLSKKRDKCIIGTGSMSDPYLPLEKDLELTKKSLEILIKHRFGVHIITKSDLILRDIELFKQARENHFSAGITITAASDAVASRIEPGAPSSDARFRAIEELSRNDLFCGILFMPILPFITDNKTNILNIIKRASDSGARFIFPWFSVTLRDRQREYFYQKLDEFYPGLRKQYEMRYKNSYECASPNAESLYKFFNQECEKRNIITQMDKLPWIIKESK
jgi:DNA repair photolyase